jgi:hypothetical protein
MFNVIDVIFKFESLKRKAHKVLKNNDSSKTFKKYDFGNFFLKNKQKLQLILMKIWSNLNHSTITDYQIIKDFK